MIKVSATEFQKNQGRILHEIVQLQEPVVVTSHGREAFVLVPVKEYWRLKARDRHAFYAGELSRDLIEAVQHVKMDARHEPLDEELD